MFKKILVANRGEIAIRAFRAAYELGAKTVAVYPYEDRNSMHRLKADEAYLIGEEGHPVRAYLDVSEIIRVAKEAGADAIYPGYGFLSENPDLAQSAADNGITFIGPGSNVLEMAGNKVTAKEHAISAGVPVLKSTPATTDIEVLLAGADEIGFPVFAKAVAGGGGRGMRRVDKREELRGALEAAMREADSAFGDPTMFIEQAVVRPRHIEVQILADAHGNVLHLFERECSVQRRHQKVIEEAPSPLVERTEGMRDKICGVAVALARAAEYTNAGTVEFISDQDGNFYFIEMNTRLQVEHPITEAITGLDIVEWQIRVANGEALDFTQEDLKIDGHAIECRVYAEDPSKRFMPAPGSIGEYVEPTGEGIRVDSGVSANRDVTPYYDPMVSKVTTHASTREGATALMKEALGAYTIEGLTTNLSMHLEVLEDEVFENATYDTSWLESR